MNGARQSGIKRLMSKYGYSALVVYIGVTFISLPACYFTVHSVGEEKISILLNRGKQLVGYGESSDELVKLKVERKRIERLEARKKYMGEELESETSKKDMTLREKLQLRWDSVKTSPMLTELLLAYGLHKSLIFVRIPLTAAITPSIARILPSRFVNRTGRATTTSTISSINRTMMAQGQDKTTYPKQAKTELQKWFNGLF